MTTSPVRKMTGHLRNGQNMRVDVIADKLSLKWQRFLLFLYFAMLLTYPFQYLLIKLKTPITASLFKKRVGPQVIHVILPPVARK